MDTLYSPDDVREADTVARSEKMDTIVDSLFRLHAYLLLRGWMYLYFVQLLHLLCWMLIVFRPVLASFVLDLICILPLDLMHFARVDP